MKAGAAVRAIELEAGLPLGGYAARQVPATGTSRALTARALVLSNDDTRSACVIVTLDLVHAPVDLVEQVRSEVTKSIGIASERVLVSAIHTHCGPRDITKRTNPALVARIARIAAATATDAFVGVGPARLVSGEAGPVDIGRSRRDTGTTVDDSVQVLLIEAIESGRPSGRPVAAVVNMACHPTVLDHTTLSYDSDFVGALREDVERSIGGVCIYLQGFAGDINPVCLEHSLADVRRVGARAAAPVIRMLTSLLGTGRPGSVANLSVGMDVVVDAGASQLHDGKVTVRSSRVVVVARDRAEPIDRPAATVSAVEAERWIFDLANQGHEHTRSSDPLPSGRTVPKLEVQTISIGDELVIVALPGEPLSAVRKLVTRGLPGRFVLTVGYSNAAPGYLPTREDFPRSGYEVGATRFAPGTVERLAEAAVELARR